MKKVVGFDLDETIAETKSPITDEMSELLGELLHRFQVVVMSGGGFKQFETQLLANLHIEDHLLANLHIMPTCGTRYYRYEDIEKKWHMVYAHDLKEAEKKKIIAALEEGARELGYWPENPVGETIEDRESQITFSALGQHAAPSDKKAWDADGAKKKKLRDLVAEKIPEFEVRVGGTTSIDVTKPGVDKAYGMEQLMKTLEMSVEEIIYVGDRLYEGGNDYPVKLLGIDTVAVSGFEETPLVVRSILAATS